MDINSLNKVILVGNVGGTPELRYLPNTERAVCKFSLATNERIKSGDTMEVRAEWHKLVVWGKTAEFCNTYVTKGQQICVEGKLRTRSWEDKNGGGKRYMTEIEVSTVTLLGRKDDRGGGGGGPELPETEARAESTEGEVPF